MIWDAARLHALLGDASMQWLRDRLRRNVEAGRPLPRTAVLRSATAAQCEHVDRLFGRVGRIEGGALSIDVTRLGEVLRDARVCDDLVEALATLDGPLRDRAGEARSQEAAWAQLDSSTNEYIGERAWLLAWYRDARGSGLLTRVADGNPERGATLIGDALRVVVRWPEHGISLPEFAASIVGDAHALDAGRPLGTLLVRAAAAYGELDDWQSADGRRDCWAAVGVLCDELSAPVLTLGLSAAGNGLTDAVLRMYADAGEACSLSLRQLVRSPPCFGHLEARPVFVCENPAVVAAAVDRLGARSAPLVCTAGYLRGATRRLLRQLSDAGARLRVRADFDVDGLHIAAKTLALPHASPWRFDVLAYTAGAAGPSLRRESIPETPWDPSLSAAMAKRQVSVHEEALLPMLLEDLAAHAD